MRQLGVDLLHPIFMKYKIKKQIWLEARQNYLQGAHTKESEVLKDRWDNEYFYLDGYKIFMPESLMSTRNFFKRKY